MSKCSAMGKGLRKPWDIHIRDTRLYVSVITGFMHRKIIVVFGLNGGTINRFF